MKKLPEALAWQARLNGKSHVFEAFKTAVLRGIEDQNLRAAIAAHFLLQLEAARAALLPSRLPEEVLAAFEQEAAATLQRLRQP